jgi:methylmalonyl-CoA mutase N-terminal domain/subunit
VLALPSAKAAEIAVRTQQVIMEETGVGNVADPLGGSWYVEALTDRLEARPRRSSRRSATWAATARSPAGSCAASRTAGSCPRSPRPPSSTSSALEKGDKKVVGVNVHTDSLDEPLEILRVSHEVEVEQNRTLAARRAARTTRACARAGGMVEARAVGANAIPPMLEAVRAEATLGEICDALRQEWGDYREPPRF